MSTRAIAPVVGVSQSSVRDDLQVSRSYSPAPTEAPAPQPTTTPVHGLPASETITGMDLAQRLEALEKPAALERQAATRFGGNAPGPGTRSEKEVRPRDIAAEAVGTHKGHRAEVRWPCGRI